MKKLLGIIVLGLLLSGNAYAKEIILDKCYPSYRESFNSNQLNHYYYNIDTSKKIMNSVVNWKKKPENAPKVNIVQYNLKYIDNNFIKGFVAEKDGASTSIKIVVDLNDKTISYDGGLLITCE